MPSFRHPLGSRPRRGRRHGLTLVEILVSLTIFGLVMTAVTRQLIEGVSLTLKSSRLLEYARSSRFVLENMDHDVRAAQTIILYSEFNARSTPQTSGTYGNYLVLHQVNSSGTITRTIGYYAVPVGTTGTFSLHRHDSNDGVVAAGTLPATSTSGTHRRLIATLRQPTTPTGVKLFQNWNGRGVSVRGQFGTAEGKAASQLNLVQCTFATRS